MKCKYEEWELKTMMSFSLKEKEQYAMCAISNYLEKYGVNGVYCSFSGGLDSTVLRHLINKVTGGCNVESVYLDTWLEDPRVREYVLSHSNVTRIRPEIGMKQIITAYGWCFPSKDISEAIHAYRQGKEWAVLKLNGLDREGNFSKFRQQYKKFLPIADWDIKISSYCGFIQKEKPAMKYEKETGKHPFLGLRAEESERRKKAYLRTGSNSFDTRYVYNEETDQYEEKIVKRPVSKPLSIWTKQDILNYFLKEKIKPAPSYGTIHTVGTVPGQLNFYGEEAFGKLTCSGDERTGCLFCPVGCHIDNFKKFKNVKKYNHKFYEYCMEELDEKRLLKYVQKTYGGELPI